MADVTTMIAALREEGSGLSVNAAAALEASGPAIEFAEWVSRLSVPAEPDLDELDDFIWRIIRKAVSAVPAKKTAAVTEPRP